MYNFWQKIGGVFNSSVSYFIVSRYATYLLQFINYLFLAVYLGPYYLGVWGFITLTLQYLSQINFGIAHSVNAIVAVHKNKKWFVEKIIGSSITLLLSLSLLILLVSIVVYYVDFGSKYNFSKYTAVVALIGVLGHFNMLFSNFFRVYGRLFEIAFNQTILPVLMAVAIFFFKRDNLLSALLISNLLAFIVSFLLFVFRSPIRLHPVVNLRLIRIIQVKGWYLFVFNTSFYLVIISTRSFISGYYSVEEFGYFTFSFSLANVILLLIQSFSFLLYPKLLNRFAKSSSDQILLLLAKVRDIYISTSHLLVHFAILVVPIFLNFFPQYLPSESAFKLVALTIMLHTNSFGYSGLLIAKGREKELAIISFVALVANIVFAYILVVFYHVPFTLVIISTMITYFFYSTTVGIWGQRVLGLNADFLSVFVSVFSLRLLVPYIVSMFLIFIDAHSVFFVLPFFLAIGLNVPSGRRAFFFLKKVGLGKRLIDF